MFNLIDDFCLAIGDCGSILDINQYCIDNLELEKENIIGTTFSDFIERFGITESLHNDIDNLTILKSTKGQIFYSVLKRKKGYLDNQPVEYAYLKDITNRFSSDKKFKKAFQNSSLIMGVSEIETGKYIAVNQSFCKTFEYDFSDVIGKTTLELNLLVDYGQRKEILDLVHDKGYVNNYEVILKTRTGKALQGLLNVGTIKVGSEKYLLIIMSNDAKYVNARNRIAESEENFKSFFHTVDDFFFILDRKGNHIYSNKSVESKLGYSNEELKNMNVLDFHPPEYRQKAAENVRKMIVGEEKVCPIPLLSKKGDFISVETRIWEGKWQNQDVLFGIAKDISIEMFALERFRKLFELNPSPILICDGSYLNIIQANKPWNDKYGWDEKDMIGKQFSDFLYSDEDCNDVKLKRLVMQKGKVSNVSTKIIGKNDELYHTVVSSDSYTYMEMEYLFLVFTDITELTQKKNRIDYLSYHDELTGLYNRAYFNEFVEKIDRKENLPLSVLMGDVNGLKLMNDVFGHRTGDEYLKAIADCMKSKCRSTGCAFRWGGDEFIVVLPKTSPEEVNEIMKKTEVECISTEYKFISINDNKPSISMGVATKLSLFEDLNRVISKAEDMMYHSKLLESSSIHSTILASMRKSLQEKSCETEKHSNRLERYCVAIAKELELSKEEIEDIRMFALLHDIGKIGICDCILMKKGPLIEQEWVEMKKHCELGYRIAQSSPEISGIAKYILSHHERWDGRGYPQGLKEEEIPLLSRILSVVDSFDAMTQHRVYRKSITKSEAIIEIKKCAGTQFDPKIVRIFCKLYEGLACRQDKFF